MQDDQKSKSVPPLTRSNVYSLSASDDAPRRPIKRGRVKSDLCKKGKHRQCFTSPCFCKCHEAKPGGAYR